MAATPGLLDLLSTLSMKKKSFTDAYVREFAARAKEVVLTDADTTARRGDGRLIARIFPTGRKLFAVRLRRGGQNINVPIGAFAPGTPEHWTVERAREARQRVSDAIARGVSDRMALVRAAHADGNAPEPEVGTPIEVTAAEVEMPHIAANVLMLASFPVTGMSWKMPSTHVFTPALALPAINAGQQAAEQAVGETARDPEHASVKELLVAQQEALTGTQPNQQSDQVGLLQQQQQAASMCPSLGQIVTNYVDALLAENKKESARDVRSAFERHIGSKHPELASRPADLVLTEEIVAVVGEIYRRGQRREAQRLRSLLSTSYTRAMGATYDPAMSSEARAGTPVRFNPAAQVKSIKGANNPGNRVLTARELGSFIVRVRRLDTPAARAAELILLLGGQRAAQLLRAKVSDVDEDDWTVTVLDTKGRRTKPRVNMLPALGRAQLLLARCMEVARQLRSEYLFTSTGASTLNLQTVSDLVNDLERDMLASGEARAAFDLRDLRRTVETRLAKKVSQEVRARLLSHGLGGVQNLHYNRYEYADEKLCALVLWHAYVESAVQLAVGGAPKKPLADILSKDEDIAVVIEGGGQ